MKWPWVSRSEYERTQNQLSVLRGLLDVPRETRPLFATPVIDRTNRKALGESAERLLSDDVFLHSVERVVDNLAIEWSSEEDPQRREEIWRTQKALALVRLELLKIVQEAVADIAVEDGEDRLTAVS